MVAQQKGLIETVLIGCSKEFDSYYKDVTLGEGCSTIFQRKGGLNACLKNRTKFI
jgi:hypothetical protein